MEYLEKQDIILINKMTVARHGGKFVPTSNFLNEGSLDFLIESVQTEMFGKELYPTLFEKAGLYMYNIISGHIFQDGNKRAGLESALLFLKLNNYRLKESLSPFIKTTSNNNSNSDTLINFTLNVAASKLELSEVQEWFKANIDNGEL